MRNLKRALSLALAAIMLIGMMVVSASATGLDDFSDKDKVVNKDAVSMLTTLGVINGKEDGSYFDPTGNVTRAEMAKMIATVLNQGADVDGLYVGMNTGLTDVKGHWAESYINYCYSLGIIAGRGNGKFDPAATVTGNEAAKMLLVAAGYDAQLEGLTGADWAIKTASLASTLGIFDNLSVATSDPLTRDNAALLIYNALDIEMIQKYENGYAIAFTDHRTLLSAKYGVYKIEGVVVSNEEAALNNTDSDFASAKGKTTMENVKVYASTTSNTTTGEYEEVKGQVVFNVSTTADMLGKTVTMYAKKTTVLSNSTVLGVYLDDASNVVKTTADTQDTMKDFLKGTGLSTDKDTAYYVNYGVMDSEADATEALGFDAKTGRFTNVNGKTNAYGVEMTAIDNDGDGIVEYVLYLQETLTQVIAKSDSKETTTLNAFNKNKAIDNENIVTDANLSEGDLVLVASYGGKYHVSTPSVVTGQMESYSSSKTKEQTITVGGTEYHPSYILFAADAADNTYEFNVLDCGTKDGVDFDIDYDFILDSNDNVIAYRPSSKGVGDYALILDSGYDPGRTNSNPTGEVKVLLADGTEKLYTLNFDASAQNVGEQLFPKLTSSQQKDNGIEELKGFLGSSVQDNTTTKPDGTLPFSGDVRYSNKQHQSGFAAGYVIEYSLNDKDVLTIKSIVGTNATGTDRYSPADVDSTLAADYDTGAARIKYGTSDQVAVDKNTVAFYFTTVNGDDKYGVAIGYDKMSNVDKGTAFVAQTTKANLTDVVLFDAEGVAAEKDYAYVLGRTSSSSGYVTLNVLLMDGTASTLKLTKSDYDSLFKGNSDFETAYAYTVNGEGVADLTAPGSSGTHVLTGYAVKLNDGTVAVYSDKKLTKLVDSYSYDKNIWNVEDVSAGTNAPAGAFSTGVAKETVLVLDADENTVRAAYIKSVLDGTEVPDHGTGSLSDGVISTSNETMISDISNQTITLTNDMADSTSSSVTTAQSKLTADVLVNALQGNVKGVYEEVFGTYKLVATNPYPVVTSAMYVGVDTNKGMVYYKIAFANPKAPVITTDLTTTAVTGTELKVVANAPDEGTLSYEWHKVSGGSDSVVGSGSAAYTASGAGEYYVVVTNTRNSLTATTKSATCSVGTKVDAAEPTFGTDLKSTGYVGDKLTVKATVTDKGTVSYQWYKNGMPLPGETGESYTPAETGKYYVIATNTNNNVNGNKTNPKKSTECDVKAKTTITSDNASLTIIAPAKDATVDGSKVTGTGVTQKSITWENRASGSDPWSNFSGANFAATTHYRATVVLTASDGYVFGDTASYSGLKVTNAQSVAANVSNNELTLVLTFAVTGS
ncbi:S-layer homology domain-containing protein [Flavonifractor plautii]|uniref:S-layer homology domain-containing protein n=1 Tax=Flavonifractor plautii TaxID=292800 RepID=UPI0018ABC30F|nr:S-layer homology domain-containing protein [Flavonifractor plautii]MDB7868460.1 S-layer homology domain-containing protein [Flavonifractor plautii]MDB7871154.1 S-layer homology domain-containing protein [Flavonifractor plautii]MDB7885727.1 S-layer homology domain-containing protein [Flavonifractor plautii]